MKSKDKKKNIDKGPIMTAFLFLLGYFKICVIFLLKCSVFINGGFGDLICWLNEKTLYFSINRSLVISENDIKGCDCVLPFNN